MTNQQMAFYKPRASLTFSARSFCSESPSSSISFSQVASGWSNQSINISRQQTTKLFRLCACCDSMLTSFLPFGSRSMSMPTSIHSGAMVLMISTFSPLLFFSIVSCAIVGFEPKRQRYPAIIKKHKQYIYLVINMLSLH